MPRVTINMDIILEIKTSLREAIRDFGFKNPLVTHYYFLWLCYRLHEWRINNYWWRKSIFCLLKRYSSLHFDQDKIIVISATEETLLKNYHYSFPEDYFYDNYEEFYKKHLKYISSSLSRNESHSFLFNRFIFVIGLNDEWFYYTKPFTPEESLIGNRDISKFPFHPLLSVKLNFKIAVAGEISFVWSKSQNNPSLVFVSNWSGHFLPKDWTAKDLNIKIRESLNLPYGSNIISMANDGVAISGEQSVYFKRQKTKIHYHSKKR